MDPGAPILVKSGFVTDAGTFVRSASDSVSIHTRNGQVTIAKDDIDEVIVFRSRSDRTRKGLLWVELRLLPRLPLCSRYSRIFRIQIS